MLSVDNSPNFFLDVLCYMLSRDDAEAKSLVQAVLETYNESTANDAAEEEIDDLSKLYLSIIRDLTTGDIDVNSKMDLSALLLKVKGHTAIRDNEKIAEQLEAILADRDKVSPQRLASLQKSIRNWVIWNKQNYHLRKMFRANSSASATADKVKQDLYLTEVLDHAREVVKTSETNYGDDGTLDFIDMTNRESVRRALLKREERRVTKVWKSGLQGVNDMYGERSGIVPGEFVGFAAASHNYKTTMLMNWTRWLCTLNSPGRNPVGIPTILFISLENEAFDNLYDWYEALYENAYKKPVGELSIDEVLDYVTAEFAKRGFNLLVLRKIPEMYGYEEWVSEHEQLRQRGYDIKASILDYATVMKLGSGDGNDAAKIQLLYRRIANYGRHHGISVFTGMQLNGAADELIASGQSNLVKRFGAGHLAGCKGIFHEMDALTFMHLETNHQGVKYLTMKLAKHRGASGKTHVSKKYAAYRFTEFGIEDDINGECTAVRNIYAEGSNDNMGKPDPTADSLF